MPQEPSISVSDAAFERIAHINRQEAKPKMLRVSVLGGGCSGFQYEFSLTDEVQPDDLVIEKQGLKLLVDAVSLPYLSGSTIHYTDEIIGARFVVDNPNAIASCGCGVSFSI